MKPIQAYITDDGQIFASEDKAKLHDMFLLKQGVVEEFLDCELNPYKAQVQRSIARQTIINWELWKIRNVK
jgi:hypothetical protein